MIGAVVFDVGECLVDETREYGTWADWLGVPSHVFSAVFGAVIARGHDYRETFQVFRPGFDLDKARQQRADEGKPEWFGDEDLYPDVRPTLARLRDEGLWVGIAGNQTARAGRLLRGLDLPADMIATSDDWGVAKPDPGFFRKLIGVSPVGPGETLYVGDRLDNDILPAAQVGLRTALINRGPWATTGGMTRPRVRFRRCGLTRWPSCLARLPRSTLERAERGLPVVEPVIKALHAVQLDAETQAALDTDVADATRFLGG